MVYGPLVAAARGNFKGKKGYRKTTREVVHKRKSAPMYRHVESKDIRYYSLKKEMHVTLAGGDTHTHTQTHFRVPIQEKGASKKKHTPTLAHPYKHTQPRTQPPSTKRHPHPPQKKLTSRALRG